MSLGLIVFVGAIVIGGTGAFFSDTETSTGNIFAAGAVDLKIDNHAWYNGLECTDAGNEEGVYTWQDPEGNAVGDSYLESLVGTTCTGTWELTDLDGHLFFNFDDLKPGDWEEDTISVHVDDNDSWMCANLTVTSDDDVDCTEPELADDANCNVPDVEPNSDNWDGDLGGALQFIFWLDDGDNVFESDENIVLSGLPSDLEGYGADGNGGETFPVADSQYSIFGDPGTPVPGGSTFFIGKAFCYGELTPTPVAQGDNSPAVNPGFTCDGSVVDNASQSDAMTADISFYVEQARNNEDFLCDGGGSGIGCSEEADVMLVLDVSGSISDPDLATMKSAATDFVTALAPSTNGVNMGVVQFTTSATLLLGLSDDSTAINAAIAGADGNGLTNLEDAIRKAQAELDASGRPAVPKSIVIITDGEPTAQDANANDGDGTDAGEAADAASDARAAGSEIFAVGVGIDAGGATYLSNSIVSSPAGTHYFDSADFGDLEAILEDLTMCPGDIQAPQV